MGRLPAPVAYGAASAVSRTMALRGGPALAMNELHMRRILASECVDGVEPDAALVRRLSRRTFAEYARYWADGSRLPYLSEEAVRAKFLLEDGDAHLRAAFALGRGIVMALPHVGSWEWGGAWLALEGMPMTAVVERLEPEELFEWFLGAAGGHGADRHPARRRHELGPPPCAQERRHLAGLVSDRDLVGNGVEVEFFGEKTTLPGGAATLALRSGAPLVPVVVYSGPGDWHTGVVHPPVDTTRRGLVCETT